MERIVVEGDFVVVEQRFVSVNERVSPGTPIISFSDQYGVLTVIKATEPGYVAQIEGKRMRPRSFDDMAEQDLRADDSSALIRYGRGMSSVYRKGDILFQAKKHKGANNGRTQGLHPTRSRRVSALRNAGINIR